MACSIGRASESREVRNAASVGDSEGLMASLPISASLRRLLLGRENPLSVNARRRDRRPTVRIFRRPSAAPNDEPIRIARKHLGHMGRSLLPSRSTGAFWRPFG